VRSFCAKRKNCAEGEKSGHGAGERSSPAPWPQHCKLAQPALQLDQPQLRRLADRLGAVANSQLRQNRGDMELDRALADP